MFLSEKVSGFETFARNLFYVFVALFPFLLYAGFIFTGTSTRAMNLVLVVEVLAIALGFLLFKKDLKISIPKSPITIALLLLLVSMFISSIFGVNFTTSFWSKVTRMSGLYYFLHLGFFYLLLTAVFKDAQNIKKLLKTFIISSAIFSLAVILSKDGFNLIFVKKEWGGFTFGNSSFAAMYLYASFMLGIYLLLSYPKNERKFWYYLIPIITVLNPYFINKDFWLGKADVLHHPLNLLGGAKASSYALFSSVIILVLIFFISKIRSVKTRRAIIFTGVAIGLVTSIFAVHSFLSPNGIVQKRYLEQASGARPMVWALSQKAISEHPVLGFGIDNFDRVYEKYYDNRVMEVKNGGEAWFDRAHNIFIDQTIETGYVGVTIYLLAYLAVIGSMLFVLIKSKSKDHQIFAVISIVYIIGHMMELQTAFDTTISYISLCIVVFVASNIFTETLKDLKGEKSFWVLPKELNYVLGVLMIGVFGTLFFVGTVPIFRAQIANGQVRNVGLSEKRIPIYKTLFGSPVDAPGFLNRTFADLQRGISLSPKLLEDPKKVEGFSGELDIFAERYEKYLTTHPEDYRTRINLADLYIYQRLLEKDKLVTAQKIDDEAIGLAPSIPQAYWQKAVSYLYQRKFDLAREWAKKALELNPNIEESQKLSKYIEESIKTFPEINFYNFMMM